MEALLAIAMLCNVATSKLGWDPRDVDKYQLKCQQEYIACYEKKLAEIPKPETNPLVWFGRLKDCTKERSLK